MLPLITTIFLASLVGSLHCAGMCGAFLAIAIGLPGASQPSPRRAATLQSLYHLGRLVSYTLLGAAAPPPPTPPPPAPASSATPPPVPPPVPPAPSSTSPAPSPASAPSPPSSPAQP